jgi:hypothetical protein
MLLLLAKFRLNGQMEISMVLHSGNPDITVVICKLQQKLPFGEVMPVRGFPCRRVGTGRPLAAGSAATDETAISMMPVRMTLALRRRFALA